MRKIVTIGIIAALLALGCAADPPIVRELAECLSEEGTGLHEAMGSPSFDVALGKIRVELEHGDTTLAEIQEMVELFCRE